MGKIGIKFLFSTTFDPQTDGQVEVMNQILWDLLRAVVHKNLRNWEEILLFVEFAYNYSIHSSTYYFPFEFVYGFNPLTLLDLMPLAIDSITSIDGEKKAKLVKSIHKKKKKKTKRKLIDKTNQTNTNRVNKGHKHVVFEFDIWVWVHMIKE